MKTKHFTVLLMEPKTKVKYNVRLFATSSTEAIINSMRRLSSELRIEPLVLISCLEL